MAAAGMDLEDIGMDMIEFENPSALDIALSEKVSGMLRSAIETDGKASLVVSGGRTPVGFFSFALATNSRLDTGDHHLGRRALGRCRSPR